MSALAAIAAPRRQAILRLVWHRERSAGDIHAEMPEVTFGAVSQHLRVLREAGVVELRREGRQHFYRARRAEMGPLASALEAMWDDKLAHLKQLAEENERGGV
jgi:DNA-binding transcriptional ArsR family regulator